MQRSSTENKTLPRIPTAKTEGKKKRKRNLKRCTHPNLGQVFYVAICWAALAEAGGARISDL